MSKTQIFFDEAYHITVNLPFDKVSRKIGLELVNESFLVTFDVPDVEKRTTININKIVGYMEVEE